MIPLLKPKFFLLTLKFFLTLRIFQNSGFFLTVFYSLEQCACHIPADHDCWLKMALMIKMVLSVFCFILCLSRGTSIMPLYIPVISGNCDRNSSIEFNLD